MIDRTLTAADVRISFCPACDVELPDRLSVCSRCGGQVVAIRGGVDANLGRVLDERYELRGFLGAGGMGTVYRAWQRSVQREVAVKLVHDRYRRDLSWIRRFLREARLSSRLDHPNVVGVVDFGQTSDGDLYLAMELLHGRVLAEVMATDGRFDRARTIRLGMQICDALSAAHAQQIVHRDLKPQNIMLLDEPVGRDFVKLLDFGLARFIGDEGDEASQSSRLLGTPYYMAPELFAKRAPSAASDLYAVGVILCEAHLGRRLFAADSFAALQVEKGALLHLPADVDPSLRDLLRALVEPNPARRPSHAADVAMRLERCARGEVVTEPFFLDSGADLSSEETSTPMMPVVGVFAAQMTTTAVPVRRGRRLALVAVSALAAAAAVAWAVTRGADAPQLPSSCEARADRLAEPGGASWSRAWHCPVIAGSALYAYTNGEDQVGYLGSTRSRLVCYRRGETHAGTDVWYKAQGDWIAPGEEGRQGWGYVSAVNVRSDDHPVTGMAVCDDTLVAGRDLREQVARVIAANPGARAIDRADIRIKPGVVMTLPVPGERVAIGAGERMPPTGTAACPKDSLCVYVHANYEGVRLRFEGCGRYELRAIVGPDGQRWDDQITSWHSARPEPAAALDVDGAQPRELFTMGPGESPFVGDDASDQADVVESCR